ncbi:MAG: LacI family DNA-binding transcriptional regulator [Eubacteriales bacterium]|nr:LacI family DNA-binding transcriptional regulator [Eubacteriales bacterium]
MTPSKNPTIVDVASLAGVSVSTVSRVLNHKGSVNSEAKNKVEAAIRELKYVPSPAARRIRGASSRVLGVILPDAKDPFFSKVLESILNSADEAGLKVLVFSCHGDSCNEEMQLRKAAVADIVGLLYCPSSGVDVDLVKSLFQPSLPLIILYRRGTMPGVPHIYLDNFKGGYLATKYLLHLGRRDIAFFAGFWPSVESDNITAFLPLLDLPNRGIYTALDRIAGYKQALDEAGLPFDESLLIAAPGFDYESGLEGMQRFLSRMRSFDALICGNDAVATGAMQTLSEQHYQVPGQISIVGYDNSLFSRITRPRLTTIHQDAAKIGQGAIQMLLACMDGQQLEDRVIDVELIVRESTAKVLESPTLSSNEGTR